LKDLINNPHLLKIETKDDLNIGLISPMVATSI